MTTDEVLLLLWSAAPVLFGAWASTPHARALMPRVLTWFYRYLLLHIFLVILVGQSVTSGAVGYFAIAVACIYFAMFDYFNADKPDGLPVGVKLEGLLSIAREGLAARSWPQGSATPQRAEHSNASLAHGMDLGLLGTNPISANSRGRLWALEVMLKAHQKVLGAKRQFNEEAIATLRSDEHLQQEIQRTQHWKQDPHAIPDRVREEFEIEADERKIRREERRERLAQQERATKEADGKREAAEAQIEVDRRRRDVRLLGQEKPRETAEDQFRRQAEQILKLGASGRFLPIAEQCRADLIAERGGVEHLTEADHERLELIFQLAQRQEESKS